MLPIFLLSIIWDNAIKQKKKKKRYKHQEKKKKETTLKNNKVGELILPDFKTPMILVYQWHRIQCSEMSHTHIAINL